ncbi:bifunctional serine/threonine-protein kinase/formylglycine-generating enzyme family protein [Halotia branconii]|uniref:Bifunctional serine/threonine-protein kinase/formylglycine-generating enzyme family protein n=1 Tax=Halotia branconii CENA392 TaxID=1539056 RepID=A0AAJ6PAV7_9CYAN|nr:bifunctional serine/threonine-protein kinase/formylglycine-generating enzyme family protein [Halotia branconii]WGV27121.1 bifunctional serine/threonine-protein kinase/formylglycine-generating enzyme family protein [Halotia branconii CENA392]
MALEYGLDRKTLDGRYKILKKLAEGNFGETYLARDEKRPSKPICVVKRLKPKYNHPKILELFEQEAVMLEKLGEHPQIPRLLAHFTVENELYIIQDYVQGHTLRKEIIRGKPLPEGVVTKLLQDILEVLVFVHRHNVIHRDIKPENVMRCKQSGKLFLIDFGSVKELGNFLMNLQRMINSTVFIGTPGYIPKEQARGRPRLCSDIYALGMMGIEALTGITPYFLQEDSLTGLPLWRNKVKVSDRLADVLDIMVCDNHNRRYRSAVEALQALTSTLVLPPSLPLLVSSSPSNPKKQSDLNSSELNQIESETVILSLEQFEFETATIEPSFNSTTAYQINRSRQVAQGFIEDLGNNINLAMVSIPGGQFLMGSPEDESKKFDAESPQHLVTVKPFFISIFPVTQAQWKAVAELPLINRNLNSEPANFKGINRPVEQVSWDDAVEFCARLRQKTGQNYRLPSEAEWEYACRARTITPFSFGETLTSSLASYNNTSIHNAGVPGKNYCQTIPVGSFPANAFGLHDMHGLVWEWCADHWHDNYEGAPFDSSVWLSKDDSQSRLIRGGSWKSSAKLCRSAYRSWNPQDGRGNILGFRVVVSF